jgi:hypothetical protein
MNALQHKKILARTTRQGGFVLTLELVILMTILGIGLFVGVSAIRNSLFKLYLSEQDQKFIVYDSSTPAKIIGEAISFDEHESPLVPFIDYGTPINYRALVGVRDDRFTTRQPLFYSGLLCTGTPCIADAGSEAAHALFAADTNVQAAVIASGMASSGSTSYLYALQGGERTYAIGAGPGPVDDLIRIQGELWYGTGAACTGPLQSVWISQLLREGDSCVDLAAPIGTGLMGDFQAVDEVLDSTSTDNALARAFLIPPFGMNIVSDPSTSFNTLTSGDPNNLNGENTATGSGDAATPGAILPNTN